MRTIVGRRLMREEQGIALVMALGMLVVCAIMVVAVTDYTSTNQRTTFYSKTRMTANDLIFIENRSSRIDDNGSRSTHFR